MLVETLAHQLLASRPERPRALRIDRVGAHAGKRGEVKFYQQEALTELPGKALGRTARLFEIARRANYFRAMSGERPGGFHPNWLIASSSSC